MLNFILRLTFQAIGRFITQQNLFISMRIATTNLFGTLDALRAFSTSIHQDREVRMRQVADFRKYGMLGIGIAWQRTRHR